MFKSKLSCFTATAELEKHPHFQLIIKAWVKKEALSVMAQSQVKSVERYSRSD